MSDLSAALTSLVTLVSPDADFDFTKALSADNFNNVTVNVVYLVPDEIKNTDFAKLMVTYAMSLKVDSGKLLETMTGITEGSTALAFEVYAEKNASGGKYTGWLKMTTGTGLTAASNYDKTEDIDAVNVEGMQSVAGFSSFKKEDFEVKDGYFVLKEDKTKDYSV